MKSIIIIIIIIPEEWRHQRNQIQHQYSCWECRLWNLPVSGDLNLEILTPASSYLSLAPRFVLFQFVDFQLLDQCCKIAIKPQDYIILIVGLGNLKLKLIISLHLCQLQLSTMFALTLVLLILNCKQVINLVPLSLNQTLGCLICSLIDRESCGILELRVNFYHK